MLDKINETAEFLAPQIKGKATTAIILGSGLGKLAVEIKAEKEWDYKEIPNFPISTVEGHAGKLILGTLGKTPVVAMDGRFHYYEGYSMREVTFPIRVFGALGISTLYVSNAAGGTNPSFRAGDLMVITDHINFMPEHPLRHTTKNLAKRLTGLPKGSVSDCNTVFISPTRDLLTKLRQNTKCTACSARTQWE